MGLSLFYVTYSTYYFGLSYYLPYDLFWLKKNITQFYNFSSKTFFF